MRASQFLLKRFNRSALPGFRGQGRTTGLTSLVVGISHGLKYKEHTPRRIRDGLKGYLNELTVIPLKRDGHGASSKRCTGSRSFSRGLRAMFMQKGAKRSLERLEDQLKRVESGGPSLSLKEGARPLEEVEDFSLPVQECGLR